MHHRRPLSSVRSSAPGRVLIEWLTLLLPPNITSAGTSTMLHPTVRLRPLLMPYPVMVSPFVSLLVILLMTGEREW